MQLKIYKLSELAKLEGIHYKTALQRAKSEKYIQVSFYSSAVGKETSRYLCKADSDIILAAFNQKAKKDATDTSKIRKPSQKKR